MRLQILDTNYSWGTKVLFQLIAFLTRTRLPDAAKITFYRPEFYGASMKRLTHEVMRGDSAWTVGDRELMAAVVSKANESPFCIGAHSATAALAYNDERKVAAVLTNIEAAPVSEPLHATLQLLHKLAREHRVDSDDIQDALNAGATQAQIEDALAVCFAFNVTARLANAFGFRVLSADGFRAGAKFLLNRGYR